MRRTRRGGEGGRVRERDKGGEREEKGRKERANERVGSEKSAGLALIENTLTLLPVPFYTPFVSTSFFFPLVSFPSRISIFADFDLLHWKSVKSKYRARIRLHRFARNGVPR